jgi:amino acid adenylation domain-containing protein
VLVRGASPCTLVGVLRHRAAEHGQREAFLFLADGEANAAGLTYAELDRRARAVAGVLQSVTQPGDRVLLLYPPGLDYITAFFGCLYAGVVAVPAYPPRPKRPMPRLEAIVSDAQARVALAASDVVSDIRPRNELERGLQALQWIDDIPTGAEDTWRNEKLDPEALAFLQYTSGSTATPKGVMLTHQGLVHHSALIQSTFEHTPETRGVSWLPPYHDMGLIGGIIQPVYAGFHATLMPPAAFVQRPVRWLQAITHTRASTSPAPNFAYDLCVRNVSEAERSELDLSCWSVALSGAEPVRAETLERFAATFASCGFRREALYPAYGLAEATLFVSGGSRSAPPVVRTFSAQALARHEVVETSDEAADSRRLVGCGQSLRDQRIVIADPETGARRTPGQVGEVWVAGGSLARGYWNQPEASKRTFHAYRTDTAEGPFLRTGDLGFVHDGELYITGRIKDLIVIRGKNHYPQDIELSAEHSHPGLQPGSCAAFAVDVASEERLIIAQEVQRSHWRADQEQIGEMVNAIRRAVAEEHELQVYAVLLLKPGSMPKTSSGKLQRHACRAGYLAGTLDVLGADQLEDAPSSEPAVLSRSALLALPAAERRATLEVGLTTMVSSALGVAADRGQSLASLGLDSLMGVELQHRLESTLSVVVPVARLLEGPTIAGLAEDILRQLDSEPLVALRHERESVYPLSFGQRALWFLHRLAPENPAYNIARAFDIHQPVDVDALRRAFGTLVERHPALRTTFAVQDGQPVQRVRTPGALSFQVHDASSLSQSALDEHLAAEAHQPFDLAEGPPLRVHLFTRSANEHVLLLVVHHIVSDLWSLVVMADELAHLYAGAAELPRSDADYSDYVRFQQELLAGDQGQRLAAYWQGQLAGDLPVLQLPTDRPRPPVQSFNGAAHSFALDERLSDQLEALARANGSTRYTLLLAAFEVLLHRLSGQEEFVVGSPTAGRARAGLAEVLGYFVNPVALRADLSGEPSFLEHLERVRHTHLGALEHADYPFPLLVERLHPVRDASRSPVFQVMFSVEKAHRLQDRHIARFVLGTPGTRVNLGGIELESHPIEQRAAQFDLTLTLIEDEGRLMASFEYDTALFDAATIHRYADNFVTLLKSVVVDPQQSVTRLPVISDTERQRLLTGSGDERFDDERTLMDLISAQAVATPNAIAITDGQRTLTYAQLDASANQLAHYLQNRGVGPETLVGLRLERSIELFVGVLGILKAGGVYVPLDPGYPAERLAFMLADSGAKLTLTATDFSDPTLVEYPTSAPEHSVRPENAAYVIYTSGSTGTPKGVVVSHRALVHHSLAVARAYDLSSSDRVLQFASVAFDVAAEETFPTWTSGATLVLGQGDGLTALSDLHSVIEDQQLTVVNLPAPYWHAWVAELARSGARVPTCLRLAIAGSDVVSPERLAIWRELVGDEVGFRNAYGPTEATITTTVFDPATSAGTTSIANVPIGGPIGQARAYVLDRHLEPVPIGAPGRLYIGGPGLARGYLGRPSLTSSVFGPDPFTTVPGGRLYDTGDMVRQRADGMLEFIGRGDQQVKIRGFRIEPGEIEAVLASHPGVRQAAVIAHAPARGDARLVAYVVPGDPQPSTDDLRQFLGAQLPAQMIPAAFVFLQELPLTSGGKVDRRALPAPEGARANAQTTFVAPRSDLERTIASIWRDVLNLEQVGANDSFFDLGGHSLLALEAHAKLQDTLGREIPVVELFHYPTIRTLAAYLGGDDEPEPIATNGHSRARVRQQLMQHRQLRAGGRRA